MVSTAMCSLLTATTGRLLTRRRLRLYPLAVLTGAVIGFALFVAASDGLRAPLGGRIGGDLPAFYGAARIMRMGAWRSIYDWGALRTAQADLLPDHPGGWLTFPYPPFVAAAYVPLTLLPFKTAYILHSAMMAACCLGALALLRPCLPRLSGCFPAWAAASLTFYPMFRAIIGGQNTALSLLCAAAAVAAIGRGRDVTAGIWLGIWLFKPQLALPVIAVVALGGHPKVVVGAAISFTAWYLLGAAVSTPSWPIWWWREGIMPYVGPILVVDGGNGTSLREVTSALGLSMVGWVAIVVAVLTVLRVVWRSNVTPPILLGLATALAILIAPHALFYDVGIVLIGFSAMCDLLGRSILPVFIGIWVFAAAEPLRAYLPLPPSTVVVIASLVFMVLANRLSAAMSQPTPHADSSSAMPEAMAQA